MTNHSFLLASTLSFFSSFFLLGGSFLLLLGINLVVSFFSCTVLFLSARCSGLLIPYFVAFITICSFVTPHKMQALDRHFLVRLLLIRGSLFPFFVAQIVTSPFDLFCNIAPSILGTLNLSCPSI